MFGIDDAALALLVAGGLSTAGTLYTNAKNRQMQKDINDTTVDLANTAHQREVYDLMLAGLNPILSAGGSGAAVPQLTSAHYDNPMQGLADGLGNSARYLNAGYKANTAMAQADAQSAAVDAALQKQDLEIADKTFKDRKITAEQQVWADMHKAFADRAMADADRWPAVATTDAFERMSEDDWKTYVSNLKKGLIASAKDAANINWRNNLGSIGGAVNSAANAYSAIRSGRSMPVDFSETIESFNNRGESMGWRTRRSHRSR